MNLRRSSISAVLAGILFVILMVARGGSGHPHKLHSVSSREKLPRLLQNSCTMKYVDLSGERPTAKGEPNTPEVDLLFGFSDSQAKANLDMYIQSAKTRRYLCFNTKGKQVLQEKFDKGLCEFNEMVSGGSHVSYINVENPDWVLAYSHNGKDLAVDHIKNRKCTKFVKSVGTQQGQKHEVQAAVDELIANHWPKPLPKEKPKHSNEKDREFSESTFKHKVVERVVSTGELSDIERFIDDEIKRQTVRRSAKRRENRTNSGDKKGKRKKKDKVSKRSQR